MRKRKDMYRRGAPLKRAAFSAALAVLGLAGAGAGCGAAMFPAAWPGFGGPRYAAGSREGTIAVMSLSVANPYALEGLVLSRCEAAIAGAVFAARFGWRRLSHPVYGEDRLTAAAHAALPIPGIFAGARVEIVQRRAAGFSADRAWRVALLAAGRIADAVSVGLAIPVQGDGHAPPPCRAWSFELFSGPLGAALDRFSPDGVSTEYLFEARCRLDSRVTLRSSYALSAGELSAGLSTRIRRIALSFSWSVHPALGLSAAAGVERWWRW